MEYSPMPGFLSIALQLAMFFASLTVIGLGLCMIPVLFYARRQIDSLMHSVDDLKVKLESLVDDSHKLVVDVNALTDRLNEHLDSAGEVVKTVQAWSERADRIVDEVGSVIEPPVFAIAQKMQCLRRGVATFLQVLFHSKSNL